MGKLIVLIIVAVLLVSLVLIKTNEISGNAAYDKDEIFIPVTVHLVKEKSSYGTSKDTEDVFELFEKVNRIWMQGQIIFIVEDVVVSEFSKEEFDKFLEGDIDLIVTRDDFRGGMINIYFARFVNANGISFPAQGFTLIGDVTTVNDFRTTAHELGHLLGLRHVSSRDYLMFKGSNGDILSQEEITLARENVKRFYA